MLLDPSRERSMIQQLRATGARGPWLHLLGEIVRLGGNRAEFLSHDERPWYSATFNGSRHRFVLRFSGLDAIEAAEILIADLPEHEFAIRDHLVADATILSVEHRIGGDTNECAQLVLEAELLLLQEG